MYFDELLYKLIYHNDGIIMSKEVNLLTLMSNILMSFININAGMKVQNVFLKVLKQG